MREIDFEIDEKGNPKLDLKGFNGKACLAATEEFERLMGKVSKRTRRPEMAIAEKAKVRA